MTNREWLERLSDEELADFLYGTSNSKCCDIASCDTVEDEEGEWVCDWDCKEGIRKWLQAERGEGDNGDKKE